MRRSINILLFMAVALATSSCGKKEKDSKDEAEQQNDAKFNKSNVKGDVEFAVKAADGGMLEVQLGELAQTHASSSQVKEFGKQMIDDHGKGNDELKSITGMKNITIPSILSDKSQKIYDELAKKNGADFDKAYSEAMVDDHKEDIEEFQKEADKGADPELRAWAQQKIPVLEHHLAMAQEATHAAREAK